MNSTVSSISIRARRLALAVVAVTALGTVILPVASQAKARPIIKVGQITPVRWLTADGGSISVEEAMAISAAGGNPNGVRTH